MEKSCYCSQPLNGLTSVIISGLSGSEVNMKTMIKASVSQLQSTQKCIRNENFALKYWSVPWPEPSKFTSDQSIKIGQRVKLSNDFHLLTIFHAELSAEILSSTNPLSSPLSQKDFHFSWITEGQARSTNPLGTEGCVWEMRGQRQNMCECDTDSETARPLCNIILSSLLSF